MASPSPSAVVRFSASTDTSVRPASSRSTSSVPTIAKPPTASGSAPATALENTTTSSTSVIGTAIISARARSRSTWSLVPWSAVTSSTRLGSPVWKVSRSASSALVEDAAGSSKPPDRSFDTTPAPSTPASPTTATATTSTSTRRRSSDPASRSNIAPLRPLATLTYPALLNDAKVIGVNPRFGGASRPGTPGGAAFGSGGGFVLGGSQVVEGVPERQLAQAEGQQEGGHREGHGPVEDGADRAGDGLDDRVVDRRGKRTEAGRRALRRGQRAGAGRAAAGQPPGQLGAQPGREDRAEQRHPEGPAQLAEELRQRGHQPEVPLRDGVLAGQDEHLHERADAGPEQDHLADDQDRRRADAQQRQQPERDH